MDQAAYIAGITAESTALAGAAAGHLDDRVPACPEWTVADLVGHLGGVFGWVSAVLAAGGARPAAGFTEPPGDRDALLDWYGQVRDQMVADLASHRPEDPAWVFVPSAPQNTGWWCRRQALESAVHRYDAQTAARTAASGKAASGKAASGKAASAKGDSLDPVLAAEGIDEYLTGLLPRRDKPIEGMTGTFHVHTTDTDGEWSLDFDVEGLAVRHEHSKADTAVRGPASDLYLWMLNRQTAEEGGLEVFGNASVVDAWRNVRF
jgi:uncharacterized protein (TIGR03083 family)